MGKFVISKDKKGEFRFVLKAGNGEVIANGTEGYSSMASCKNGIASIQKNCTIANMEDQTVEGFETAKNPKWEIYKDKAGEFRFRLKASNGEIIATGEGYKAKAGCMNGIDSIKRNAPEAEIVEKLED
ncbi:MAG: YegP family protein [Paludibacteraceae bacterium]|nr:YegP family protein [Paludibacteraceae bacterium]